MQFLEKTLIRVGSDEYARDNHSFGLTTMRDGHAKVEGATVHFEFRGKSGVFHKIDLHDKRLSRVVKARRELSGHELFQYVDEEQKRQIVDSSDVNCYLRELTNQPFTSKDFRTWGGTVLVAQALAEAAGAGSNGPVKQNVVRAIEVAAKRLGNTTAVCRKCYIHPAVIDAYMSGRCIEIKAHPKANHSVSSPSGLAPEIALVELLTRTA